MGDPYNKVGTVIINYLPIFILTFINDSKHFNSHWKWMISAHTVGKGDENTLFITLLQRTSFLFSTGTLSTDG